MNAAAIGAHVVGSLGQILGNKGRLQAQEGVACMALAKTALTAAALGVTGYARVLGRQVSEETRTPAASGTEPEQGTPPSVAAAQRKLQRLQWAVPALTGALVVVSSFAGEQQRASEVHRRVEAATRRLSGRLRARRADRGRGGSRAADPPRPGLCQAGGPGRARSAGGRRRRAPRCR